MLLAKTILTLCMKQTKNQLKNIYDEGYNINQFLGFNVLSIAGWTMNSMKEQKLLCTDDPHNTQHDQKPWSDLSARIPSITHLHPARWQWKQS